jgi:hypothetical protein
MWMLQGRGGTMILWLAADGLMGQPAVCERQQHHQERWWHVGDAGWHAHATDIIVFARISPMSCNRSSMIASYALVAISSTTRSRSRSQPAYHLIDSPSFRLCALADRTAVCAES